ncbi:hypothetical protein HK107_12355 [Parvularcula sp. ZS-1/3]|uniref:Type II secretion system protein GspC N-terminal domain-containing protein n=1 Tax=Parvularcula mediterranea TaxID=2732508 RepID=A0A7Y3RN35_9PROT|nr:type II secretion system protein N [Parvularcula mediterranea]NNU17114.1 hypothetical protein [Parvularcula mediterranea]
MGREQATAGSTKARGAFIAALVATAVLAFAAVDLVLSAITPLSADIGPRREGPAAQVLDADLSALQRANIFEGAPESEGAVLVQEELPVTTLRLKLISASPSVGGVSTAIIETPGGKQEVFEEGEQVVRGAVLDKVELWRVILRRNGRLERLLLDNRPEMPSDIPVLGEGDATPEGEPSDQQASGPRTLGEIFGPSNPLLAAAKARPTDIPLAINGEPLPEDGAAMQRVMQQLQTEGSLILTVNRDGGEVDLYVELPGDIEF